MGIPTVKTIKQRIQWLDGLKLGDQAATICRQAMEYAETGEVGKTLEDYFETLPRTTLPLWFNDRASYGERVDLAFSIMDYALETFGAESVQGRDMHGRDSFEYLNTGDAYTATVIYDNKTGTWKITSYGDLVEAYPSRFPY